MLELSKHNLDEFIFISIFIGFCFIHLSKKLILKHVGNNCRVVIEDVLIEKKKIELKVKVVEKSLTKELQKEDWNNLSLKKLASSLFNINEKDSQMKEKEKELKKQLQAQLNKDLEEVHFITNYVYHLIVGLIMITLINENPISGILFASSALVRATISNTSNKHVKILDTTIHAKLIEKPFLKWLSLTSVLIGSMIGEIFTLFYLIPLLIIFQCLAFISGIILYIIIREVIPEQEKGKPSYFLLGIAIFITTLIIIEILPI